MFSLVIQIINLLNLLILLFNELIDWFHVFILLHQFLFVFYFYAVLIGFINKDFDIFTQPVGVLLCALVEVLMSLFEFVEVVIKLSYFTFQFSLFLDYHIGFPLSQGMATKSLIFIVVTVWFLILNLIFQLNLSTINILQTRPSPQLIFHFDFPCPRHWFIFC